MLPVLPTAKQPNFYSLIIFPLLLTTHYEERYLYFGTYIVRTRILIFNLLLVLVSNIPLKNVVVVAPGFQKFSNYLALLQLSKGPYLFSGNFFYLQDIFCEIKIIEFVDFVFVVHMVTGVLLKCRLSISWPQNGSFLNIKSEMYTSAV